MSLVRNALAHVLPAQAVYFVLRQPLEKGTFLWVLRALEARAGRSDADSTPQDHWEALQKRMTGRNRWDTLAPPYTGPLRTGEDGRRKAAAQQTVRNIQRLRRYSGYTIQGLQYTVDLFNPGNELEAPYAGAGEPVFALLLQGLEPEPGPISLHLAENSTFYEILKDLDGILHPEYVCGTYSMMSVLCAYLDGRIDPTYRPWEFLFPLHVLKDPAIPLTSETRISGRLVGMLPGKEVKLAKVEDWSGGRVLIQTRPGLDAVIAWEYFAVAKALGMTPVQQLVEGSAPPRQRRADQ